MDGESTFPGAQTRPGFVHSGFDIIHGHIAKDVKPGRVGMSRQVVSRVLGRKDVNGGVLERVVAAGFEDEGKVEDHRVIIPRPHPSPLSFRAHAPQAGGGNSVQQYWRRWKSVLIRAKVLLFRLSVKENSAMSNSQVRLLSSAIALLAGGVIANTTNIDVNVSIAIIVISSVLFLVEYFRISIQIK